MGSRIVIGFIAAMLAVLIVHQPIVMLLGSLGMLPPTARPYNMAALPNAPVAIADFFKSLGLGGWPSLFNSLFWSGLWGALFGLIHERLPGGFMILKGLIFGLLIVVLSNWLAIPLIKGQPIFAGFVPARMLSGAIIVVGFGAGLGLIYGLLRRNA